MAKKLKEILENVPVGDVKPFANNPRKNDGVPVDEVAKSISKLGYRTPIIVDEDNVILVGHTRLKAIKKLGWERIPFVVRYSDLTPKQKKEYRVLDNKTGEFAEWDFELLEKDFTAEDLHELGFNANAEDYSKKNSEVNVVEFSADMKLVLEFTEKDYKFVVTRLQKIDASNENAILKLLKK